MNKKVYVDLSQQDVQDIINAYEKDIKKFNKQKEILDKIKEEVEYWGYEEEYNDDRIFCKCMKKIHELLEEIE